MAKPRRAKPIQFTVAELDWLYVRLGHLLDGGLYVQHTMALQQHGASIRAKINASLAPEPPADRQDGGR